MKYRFLSILFLTLFSCSTEKTIPNQNNTAYRITKAINYNNIGVDVVIDKPSNNDVDLLVVFHGTVYYDNKILDAANKITDNFKNILDRKDMMIISVAYREEGLLMGEHIKQAEAALLWSKHKAGTELGVNVKKIFLAGHSLGGYLVTRLNTMYHTNGVIANAPGPLNLLYRCQLEENGQAAPSNVCNLIKAAYGSTSANPDQYNNRSLLNFTGGFKSDILFIQGLQDSPVQMFSYPAFKQGVLNCSNCQHIQFLEIPDGGHASLFASNTAKTEFNNFINSR
ncbi:MAG: alpha/beta hydrolase family protein [Niabella sp.]